MDINIKYKQQDKKEEVYNLVKKYKSKILQAQGEELESLLLAMFDKNFVQLIDAIYKEDSKQIESVEISGHYLKALWQMLKWQCEGAEPVEQFRYNMYKELKPYKNQLEG
jgi:hypothetical protein